MTLQVQVLIVFFLIPALVSCYLGILLVKFENGQTSSYCISYDDQDGRLPPTYTEQDFHPLNDLTPDPFCELPINHAPLNGTIVEALGTANCTGTDRGSIAEECGALAVVLILIKEHPNRGNTSSEIPVVYMTADDHLKLLEEKNHHGSDDNVDAVLYSPEIPTYDSNVYVIWTFVTAIVAVGGYWSGLTAFKIYTKKRGHRARSTSQNTASSQSDSESDTEDDEEETVQISVTLVIIWVVMIVAFLLLLFFFYNICVYIVIAMYCIGSWIGLYVCFIPIVKRCMGCKLSTSVLPIVKKRFSYTSIGLAAVSLVPVICWFVFRHEDFAWILQDFLGAVFCISMLKIMLLPNFKICTLLLGLLFIYDLFFVFITPLLSKDGESVMLKVATGGGDSSEQLPVLFAFPSMSSSPYKSCKGYSMIGFGDVLVPGLLVGFCYGFDLKVNSRRIYYIASTCAYGLGVFVTFLALILMQKGQPALVYIVPSMLVTVTTIGCFRREFKLLWLGTPTKEHRPLRTGEINNAVNE